MFAFKNEAKKEKRYLLYFLIRLYLKTDTEMIFLPIGVSKKEKEKEKEIEKNQKHIIIIWVELLEKTD